eukprot:510555_1
MTNMRTPLRSKCTQIIGNVFKITITAATLIIIVLSIIWYHISTQHQKMHKKQNELPVVTQRGLYFLPVDTEKILLSHDNKTEINNDEDRILSEIFDLFDVDHDKLLDFREYKQLINVTMKPKDQFDKMKTKQSVDMNNLKYTDLISFFITLDVTDLYKGNDLKELVFSIFNHSFNDQNVDVQYYKFLANIFYYILDHNKDCLISSEEFVSYISTKEWKHKYNYDKYDSMNLTQFASTSFDTIYYKNYQRSQLSYITNQYKFDQILIRENLNFNNLNINKHNNCHQHDNIIGTNPYVFSTSIDDVVFIQLPHPLHFIRSPSLLMKSMFKRRLQASLCDGSLLDHGSDCVDHTQCCSGYCLQTCNDDSTGTGAEQRKCRCLFKDMECQRDDECCSYTCINDKCSCSSVGQLCHSSMFIDCCNIGIEGRCVTTSDDWTQWRCQYEPTPSPTESPTTITETPTLKPTSSPAITNAPTISPFPSPRPTARPTPQPTLKPISSSGGGGFDCFSQNSLLLNRNNNSIEMTNINIGDYIFDGDQYTKVIAIEKGAGDIKVPMISLYLFKYNKYNILTINSITLTPHHLLYNNNNSLISAADFQIGDVLYDNFTIYNILVSAEFSVNVVTMSGYLQVNGIKSSCYVENEKFANGIHTFAAIFRWTSKYVSEYYTNSILQWLIPESGNLYRWIFKDSEYEKFFVHNKIVFIITASISTIV